MVFTTGVGRHCILATGPVRQTLYMCIVGVYSLHLHNISVQRKFRTPAMKLDLLSLKLSHDGELLTDEHLHHPTF